MVRAIHTDIVRYIKKLNSSEKEEHVVFLERHQMHKMKTDVSPYTDIAKTLPRIGFWRLFHFKISQDSLLYIQYCI